MPNKSIQAVFCLVLLSAATGSALAAEQPRLAVAVPFVELHTGPGRGYPVFHVVERGDTVTVLKRRTDWFKVRTPRQKEGWVSRQQIMQTDMAQPGGSFSHAVKAYDRRRAWRAGFDAGQLEGEPAVTVSGAYRLSLLRLGAELTDVAGRFSSTRMFGAHVGIAGPRHWPVIPVATVGMGLFSNDPRITLVDNASASAYMATFGGRLEWPLGRRFLIDSGMAVHRVFFDQPRDYMGWSLGLKAWL